MVTTLEGLRCLSRKAVWDIAQALQKDVYETLALLRGERQHTLTPAEVTILAQCLEVSFEQVVVAANTSYAVNCYHRLTPPVEETLEAHWRREAADGDEREHDAMANQSGISDRFRQAFELLGLPMEATVEQIWQAFRARVREASDGKGGYREDMDRVVQAKELALDFRRGTEATFVHARQR
jgi:hypothetical protein